MKNVVVKIGSSVIAPQGKLDIQLINSIVKDILQAERDGFKIILVSSGAIACGLSALGQKRKPQDIHSLMAFSSLGQIILMDVYKEKFKKHKRLCAQILLTWDDFDSRKRFLNARYTIQKLLNLEIVPIVNENDAVSFEEIKFGDNDRLSALVADLIGADSLLILSDIDGLIENGEVINVVPKVDSRICRLARKEDRTFTSGGMAAKLEAAKIAASAGIRTIISNGRVKDIISRLLRGDKIGTSFLPKQEIKEARKRWIAFSKKIKGKIYIDDGAKEAIIKKGKSLLSVGIVKIEGDFKKKDAVQVLSREGKVCGCGLIDYSSEELRYFKGRRFDREVIHRDNFVKKEN